MKKTIIVMLIALTPLPVFAQGTTGGFSQQGTTMNGTGEHHGERLQRMLNSPNPQDRAFAQHLMQEREQYRTQMRSEVQAYRQQRRAERSAGGSNGMVPLNGVPQSR